LRSFKRSKIPFLNFFDICYEKAEPNISLLQMSANVKDFVVKKMLKVLLYEREAKFKK